MTQHFFESSIDNTPVTVLCGWDRRMRGFFLEVTDFDDDESVIYSSSNDKAFHRTMGFSEDFKSFENVMAGLGLAYPSALAKALEREKQENVGNMVTQHGKISPTSTGDGITHARITDTPRPMPEGMADPMPQVFVKVNGGPEISLFTYFPDEINFQAHEFIGLTIEQARNLRTTKDKAYLVDSSVPCASGAIVNASPIDTSIQSITAAPGSPFRQPPPPPGSPNRPLASPPGTPALTSARAPGRTMRP